MRYTCLADILFQYGLVCTHLMRQEDGQLHAHITRAGTPANLLAAFDFDCAKRIIGRQRDDELHACLIDGINSQYLARRCVHGHLKVTIKIRLQTFRTDITII